MYNMFSAVDDFPEFNNLPDYDTYFREQIVYFYFNLTRKEDTAIILKLGGQFRQVLQLLKKQLHNNLDSGYQYLDLLYRMVAETRDIFGGKGEHDLSYCLLMNLYEVYPTLAIFLLHRFVQPIECSDCESFGSWRDMKYFCDFLTLYSNKNENHPLIDICIKLINNQLAKDLHSWKFSKNAFSRDHISYVSKWIPRENKKFDWLFMKLAVHWSNEHKPYLLNTTNVDSYLKALNKVKKSYRKVISPLNKGLDTTQIKQCSLRFYDIHPPHVSSYTAMKQNNLVFASSLLTKYNLFDRIKCSQLFEKHFESIFDKQIGSSGKSPLYFTVSHFIKAAIRLKQNPHHYEINVLNKQWECLSKSLEFTHFENLIPMLDISFSIQTDTDTFYSAIGIALLIAQNSNYGKRILMMDHAPTWLMLDQNTNFISNVENIMETIKINGNTNLNVEKAFELLKMGLIETVATNNFINSMRLIFISTFDAKNSPIYVTNAFEKIFTQLSSNSINSQNIIPNIVFWNLNKNTLLEPASGRKHISGTSYFLINHVRYNNTSQYDFVSNILNQSRYNVLSDYILSLLQHPIH